MKKKLNAKRKASPKQNKTTRIKTNQTKIKIIQKARRNASRRIIQRKPNKPEEQKEKPND